MTAHSQARTLSGIRAFYKFLIMEDMLPHDPTETIEAPKLGRKLPDTLNFHEIEQLLTAIDLSTPEGTRNRAMLETLYSSGPARNGAAGTENEQPLRGSWAF